VAGNVGRPRRAQGLSICLSTYLAEAVEGWLSTTLDAEPVELGLREILTNALLVAA
jgi:hypothetical protein